MLSQIRLSAVSARLSSVTFVRPAQPLEIFGNVSSPFCTLAVRGPPCKVKFTGIVPGELLHRGYKRKKSIQNIAILDLSKFEGYISERVQDTYVILITNRTSHTGMSFQLPKSRRR